MGKFVPVSDPEKARSEQDENSMRKHRQFDTPHAHLKKDLNKTGREPKGDMEPMGRQTGELELDENKLWQKKNALFEQEKTWGRETFQMGNQEQANQDGKKTRDVMAEALFGRSIGFKGGRGADSGDKVIQRSEVDQALVKNEKGLWVRKKIEKKTDEDIEEVSGDSWRCPKCKDVNIRKRNLCKECGYDRSKIAEESGMLRAAKKGEDPRLEAAAAKGRGTADAAAQALKALEAKRTQQKAAMDDCGLSSRSAHKPRGLKGDGKASYGINSSASQVHSQRRHPKHGGTQGVATSAEGARKVVIKALGEQALKEKASSSSDLNAGIKGPAKSGDMAAPRKRKKSESPVRGCSLSVSRSRSGSSSPVRETGEDVEVSFF